MPHYLPRCLIDRRCQQVQHKCSNAEQQLFKLHSSVWLCWIAKHLFSCSQTIHIRFQQSKCLSKANMKVWSLRASDMKPVCMTQDWEIKRSVSHNKWCITAWSKHPSLKIHQAEWNAQHTSLWLRYKRRQIETLGMAHYQWVYGKITIW